MKVAEVEVNSLWCSVCAAPVICVFGGMGMTLRSSVRLIANSEIVDCIGYSRGLVAVAGDVSPDLDLDVIRRRIVYLMETCLLVAVLDAKADNAMDITREHRQKSCSEVSSSAQIGSSSGSRVQ